MQDSGENVVRNGLLGPGILPGKAVMMLRAILTDSHFWVPLVVLGLGVVLLMRLV